MMQAAQEFHWHNENGNRIYAVDWPVAEARAVIGLVHGVGEHCRRYDDMVDWFRARGIACVGYDRQGYGQSEGRRGYAKNYKEFVDEIATLTVECERRYKDTPVFLYGHSMGGHLLLRYLIRRHPRISGAILSAPHIQLAFQPNPLLVGLGKAFRTIFPTFTQSSALDLSQLSRSPEVQAKYEQDPFVHDRLTSRTGIDILENADALNAWTGELPVPSLLMHGSADGLTSFDASAAFAARNPTNLTWKEWPGLYHELHHEPEREEVFAYVLAWMEERMDNVHRSPKSV
ncbi:lysophospholipase [Neolewinella lacunae]|nr:alpha/beta hydrolase [Neolewinella lacunae]MDN3634916.1 lysophospholipase [Neolewinella lacunae]